MHFHPHATLSPTSRIILEVLWNEYVHILRIFHFALLYTFLMFDSSIFPKRTIVHCFYTYTSALKDFLQPWDSSCCTMAWRIQVNNRRWTGR